MHIAHSEFWIDADDRIVWLNDAFRTFALENGAAELARTVVGNLIWRYMAGEKTEAIYRTLFERVRAGRTLRLPYRCDAPEWVREFELELTPRPNGGIGCRTDVRGERPREPVVLVDATATRSSGMLTMCGWCKRVLLDDWVAPELAVARLGLFDGSPIPEISHGICEPCQERLLRELE